MFCKIFPAILSYNLPLARRVTLCFHNLCNIRKKCHVASASKNIPRVAAALPFKAELLQRVVSKDPLVNCCIQNFFRGGGGVATPNKDRIYMATPFIGKTDQILVLFMG